MSAVSISLPRDIARTGDSGHLLWLWLRIEWVMTSAEEAESKARTRSDKEGQAGCTKQVTDVKVVASSRYDSQFPLLIRVNIEDRKYIYFLGGNNHGSCQRFNVKE